MQLHFCLQRVLQTSLGKVSMCGGMLALSSAISISNPQNQTHETPAHVKGLMTAPTLGW